MPEYAFTIECDGQESEESDQLDIMGWISLSFNKEDYRFLENYSFYLYKDNWKSESFSYSELRKTIKDIPIFNDNKLKVGVVKNG